jgi:hypothetical protein
VVETDREIAFRTGCGEDAITVFEALFFNVREKLIYRDYILNPVLAQSITQGLTDRQHDLLWKLVAYAFGPYALDAMIGRFVNPQGTSG